jgi:hypothetical protein
MDYKFLLIALLYSASIFAQGKDLKFNHIYFVLDAISYNELKKNKSFQNFANLDEGLPTFNPIGKNATTIYMRGKNTYIDSVLQK